MKKRTAQPRVAAAIAAGLLMLPAASAASPPERVVRGEHLYGQYCLACHGADGGGVESTKPGRIGAAPLRTQASQKGFAPSLRGVGALAADFYLRTGYMPLARIGIQPRRARVLLTERQIEDLTAYVASLGAGPPIPAPHPAGGSLAEGMHAFTDHCAGCHQIVAEGGYVTGALPPPLEDDSDVQIAEAVRIGPYVMPSFSQRAIPDRELDSIVAYIDYAKHPDDNGGWALGHLGPVPEGLVTWFVAALACVVFCLAIGRRLERE
jgi:ubiquinol-cytochrome c reductase cytochrome c subunit